MKCFLVFKRTCLVGLIALSAISVSKVVFATEQKMTTRDDQSALALSLYQNDLALVKDTRRITFDNSRNLPVNLVWQEISAKIKPETAWIRHLTNPGRFQLMAQHFNLDLLTPQKLLEAHIGKSITVIRTHPISGEELREDAIVLTTNGGLVLKYTDRIETGLPDGRLAFSEIPNNLYDKPAMVALFNGSSTDKQTPYDLQLTYLTHGLSWRADYILELDQQDRHVNLVGLATLINQSGIAYHDAQLQLIAGDVNQVRGGRASVAKQMSFASDSVSAVYNEIEAESHFELYRYSLPDKITLPDNQSKQIAFMSASKIPIDKNFILQGQSHYYSSHYQPHEQQQTVEVYIKFLNSGEGLGVPLPSGIMRTYQQDLQNDLHFIGEDRIQHTAKQAIVELKLGNAFDVTAKKKQIDFKKLPHADQTIRQFETTHQIHLSNTKKEAVTIIIREPIPGEWTIIAESQPHQRIASNWAQWQIKLPAKTHVVLDYRVRVTL